MDFLSDTENLPYILIPLIILLVLLTIYLAWRYEKKRTKRLREIADSLRFTFDEKGDDFLLSTLTQFHLFSQGRSRRILNVMKGKSRDAHITIMDYLFTTGGGKNSSTYRQTVILFDSDTLDLPAFSLRPENFIHRIGNAFGYQDIDFDSYPEFSRMYLLQGADEEAVRNTFDYDLLSYFEKQKNICVEGEGRKMIFYRAGKRFPPAEIKLFYERGLDLYTRFSNYH